MILIDYFVLGLYFAVILGIGFYSSKNKDKTATFSTLSLSGPVKPPHISITLAVYALQDMFERLSTDSQ